MRFVLLFSSLIWTEFNLVSTAVGLSYVSDIVFRACGNAVYLHLPPVHPGSRDSFGNRCFEAGVLSICT